ARRASCAHAVLRSSRRSRPSWYALPRISCTRCISAVTALSAVGDRAGRRRGRPGAEGGRRGSRSGRSIVPPGHHGGRAPRGPRRLCQDSGVILADPFPPSLPAPLEAVLTTRAPMDEDVGPVVELIQADQRRIDPEARVDPEGVRSRLVGLRSWSRRQLVVVPREPLSSAPEVVPVGWLCAEDRAAGRSNVQWSVAGHVPRRAELIACLLAWAAEVGGSFARHRGVETTQLNVSVDSRDKDSRT